MCYARTLDHEAAPAGLMSSTRENRSISMESNANQVADKSDRDSSEGKATHLAAFVMTAMRVCMQRAAKASSTEGARQSDGMRRKHLQIECFSVHVHCKMLKKMVPTTK